jgi:BirA family biotin operon repressor/biotin-[acetyl-CoA-carboxylase] ligase
LYKILANNSIVGKKLIFMPSCHSTNDISAELVSKGEIINGTIIITDHQINGRGQGSNKWESDQGENLTLSLIVDTSFLPVHKQFYLNMVVCLSLSDLLTEYLHSGVLIKWPNDIYYKERKICGILIQNILKGNRFGYSILGMGINVNQQEFQNEMAISLRNVTGKWYDLQLVLNRLSEIIEEYYKVLKQGNYIRLRALYMKKLMWLNENRVFEADVNFNGSITDIDESGRLMISTKNGIRTFSFKEVKFIE